MELDLTTFILEIINFLVLVWLLQRFLYKPVLRVMNARRAAISDSLAQAKQKQDEAETLKQQYENRLASWRQERDQARQQLQAEIDKERRRLLAELQSELDGRAKKEEVLTQRRDEERLRQARQQARQLAQQFAARLLARLANAAVEAQLLHVLLEDLATLPQAQRKNLAEARQRAPGPALVESAYPLPVPQRESLCAALRELLGTALECEFREDAALLAGLRISIGPHRLQANIKEELRFFGEALSDE